MSKSTSTQVATSTKATGETFATVLKKMEPQLRAALPKHLTAERMIRIVTTEYRKNPKIGECSIESVLGATVMLAQLGLEPGIMGQAFLVPYRGECQGIPGWQGIVDLISRTGRGTVWTGAVYDGDFFEYELGDSPYVHHRPGDEVDHSPNDLIYTYAIGRVKGAEWPNIEVWSAAKLRRHRDRYNKVGDKHYSYGNWELYCRKVPLLQVAKYMPRSVELQAALDLEDAAEKGVTIDLDGALDGSVPPPPAAQTPEQPKEKPSKTATPKEPTPVVETKVEQTATPEPEGDGSMFTTDEIMSGISDADNLAAIDAIMDVIRSVKNEKNKSALQTMAENKRARLQEEGGKGGGSGLKME